MNVKTNVRAYLTPCIREVICTPGKRIMNTSPLLGITHEGFDDEDGSWDGYEDYDE